MVRRAKWLGSGPAVVALLLCAALARPSTDGAADATRPWPAYFDDGMAALARDDAPAALAQFDSASRLAPPNHPLVLYAQTRAYVRAARLDDAFRSMSLLVDKGVAADLLVSPAFDALRDDPRWAVWQPRLQALVDPVQHSVVAFRLNEADFFPEAITYDRGSRRFLVGSLFKRKIVVIDEISGRVADYATWRESGFLSVLGLGADNTRGALYVLSAGGAEMQGYRPEFDGQSFLHRLQLSSGRQVSRLTPPAAAGGHLLNAIVQAPDGTIYMTDSKAGRLYRWRPGSTAIEPFVALGTYVYPNGLAWSGDGRALYVAHLDGISRVDVRTRDVSLVGHPASMTLVGIDGLSEYRGDLIAVQNGVPGMSRVVRLHLTSDGSNVRSMDLLDTNLPDHDMPTSGVVVGDGFYYVANSQLRRFTAPGVPAPVAQLQKPVIRRINLAG
ncbi:MAG: SMP-30/gluconolactonase/LRE family protein [Acidobacteria bacterium]|nr:SMP-30/gluconolactonase/LRE family protein [Acidobacteriota bacterium]